MARRRRTVPRLPGGRRRAKGKPARSRWLRRLRDIPLIGWLMLATGVIFVLPPVIDAAKGLATPTEGCRVWQVTDGDTVKIFCPNGRSYRARILAYDAPELFSPKCTREWAMAVAATAYLHWQLWTARRVTVRQEDTDRYGRRLIVLLFDGEGVARRMVNAGLARWYDGGVRAGWCA